jgi:hypothetical protein
MRAGACAATIFALSLLAFTPQDSLRDAINLGHTRDEALFASFNTAYFLTASGTVDSAEVLTEFRRAVVFVRQREALADYVQDTHTLASAIAPYAGLVTFIVQARLNPLNTFTKAPNYDLYISTGPSTPPLAGKPFTREPIYPLNMQQPSGMIAVRLTASFPRADIEAAPQPTLLLTDDHAGILWQTRIDLSRYR